MALWQELLCRAVPPAALCVGLLLPAHDVQERPAPPLTPPPLAARAERVAADRRVEALQALVEAMQEDPLAFRVVAGMGRFQRLISSDGVNRPVEFGFAEGDAEFVRRVGRAHAALDAYLEAHGRSMKE